MSKWVMSSRTLCNGMHRRMPDEPMQWTRSLSYLLQVRTIDVHRVRKRYA